MSSDASNVEFEGLGIGGCGIQILVDVFDKISQVDDENNKTIEPVGGLRRGGPITRL